jgi:hypothetical protein
MAPPINKVLIVDIVHFPPFFTGHPPPSLMDGPAMLSTRQCCTPEHGGTNTSS